MVKLPDIKKIGIVGAGTMGLGIAQISAMAGYQTILFDIEAQMLAKALQRITNTLDKGIEKGRVTAEQKEAALAKITTISVLEEMVADVVIEAVAEKLSIKQQVFATLEKVNSKQSILASNTSSIPITQIGTLLQYPEKLVGMHFFNPAHIMKLVEVISGASTAPAVAKTIKELAIKLGKVPVMAKDAPGFIVNRVARHFYLESLKILEEGVANFATIDQLMQASGFKMGPFQLMDLIGIDTNFSVTTSMFEAFYKDAKFRPNQIQRQKVDAGHHGRKSGQGFYKY